jgi:hypothetical protein
MLRVHWATELSEAGDYFGEVTTSAGQLVAKLFVYPSVVTNRWTFSWDLGPSSEVSYNSADHFESVALAQAMCEQSLEDQIDRDFHANLDQPWAQCFDDGSGLETI